MENEKIEISLKISHFIFDAKEISTNIKREPTHHFKVGDKYYFSKFLIEKIADYNYWAYTLSFSIGEYTIASNILKQFIKEIILPNKTYLKEINSVCKKELYLFQNIWNDAHPSLFLDYENILLLGELEINIDLDLFNNK